MKLFRSARLRLTLWYLLIIAIISIGFSGILYREFIRELARGYHQARQHLHMQGIPQNVTNQLLEDEFVQANSAIVTRLATANGLILIGAGVAGYFLAGKTLKPIEDMMDEQKRFTADASHELRTPLAAMKSEIEVALRNKRLNSKEAQSILASNLEEVERISAMTEELLLLNRYDSGTTNIEMQKHDLSQLVTKAVKNITPQAIKKNITIKKEMESVNVNGHAQSLTELATILLDNAIKYSPQNSSILVTTKKQNRNAVLEVADSGIGIAKKDMPHIFDRFYQAEISRSSREEKGFGLGLSIAKKIADLHKGELSVKSKLEKGSTFTLTLPRS